MWRHVYNLVYLNTCRWAYITIFFCICCKTAFFRKIERACLRSIPRRTLALPRCLEYARFSSSWKTTLLLLFPIKPSVSPKMSLFNTTIQRKRGWKSFLYPIRFVWWHVLLFIKRQQWSSLQITKNQVLKYKRKKKSSNILSHVPCDYSVTHNLQHICMG